MEDGEIIRVNSTDGTPFDAAQWINNRWRDGSGSDILQRDNEAIQAKMRQTENSYIQVFTITAEKVELHPTKA